MKNALLRTALVATLLVFFIAVSAEAQVVRSFTQDMITSQPTPETRTVTLSLNELAGQGDDCGFGQVPVGQVINYGIELTNSGQQGDLDLTNVTAQVEHETGQFELSNFDVTQGSITSQSTQGATANIGTLVPGQTESFTWTMEAVEAGQANMTITANSDQGPFPGSPIVCIIDVGFFPITITGTKWDDVNANGTQDGNEAGVGGVTIYLDLNDNASLDNDESSATTGSNGAYELVHQPDQEVTHVVVREIVPDGFEQTFPGGTSGFYEDDLDHGTTVRNANFGNREIPTTTFTEIDQYALTTALVQLVGGPLGEVPVSLVLQGPTEVHVFFEGPNEGDAEDDNNNDRDEVQTELVQMELTGGGVTLRESSTRQSVGQIEETTNNTPGVLDVPPFTEEGTADSFFDVFFDIELPDGSIVHNSQPLFVQAVILSKPPFDRYIHLIPPSGPIELVGPNNQPTGVFITRAEHYTGFVEIDTFEETTALMQLQGGPLGTSPVPFLLRGPAEVIVCFEGPEEGDTDDDDDNDLDEVVTRMTRLELTGGGVTVRLNPNQLSEGQIEELENNNPGLLDVDPFADGDADSFFDIFVEIELSDGTKLYNDAPLFVQATIGEKPPRERYIHLIPPSGPVELVDANGNGTGIFLIEAEHNTGEIEKDRFPLTAALLQLQGGALGPAPVPFVLTGSAEAHVFFEGREGQAEDDDDDNLDDVVTELVELNLTDGTVTLTLNGDFTSLGEIEEKLNNNPGLLDLDPFADGDANSFFDVFFEIEVPDGQGGTVVLHNNQALRIEAMIGEKPPKDRYIHVIPPDGPLQLFTENNQPSGIFLVKAEHNTGEIEVDVFDQTSALIQLVGGPIGEVVRTFFLSGPATVDVFFEGVEGAAEDDDGDGLDEVQTNLRVLDLRNGGLRVTLNELRASLGEIEEKVNNNPGWLDLDPFHDGDANSFFDVFFKIELPDGSVVFNGEPLRIEAMISEKPPFDRYIHVIPPDGPIELVDANGNGTGVFIVAAEHNTGIVEVDEFDQTTALVALRGGPLGEAPVPFTLRGPATVHVFFEGAEEGDANDDDGNNLDDVATRITLLELTDGNVTMRLYAQQASIGQIEEKENTTPGLLDVDPFAPGDADSFFDVFVEIELPDGTRLHNEVPVRIEAMISHKPPRAPYFHILPEEGPIELFTEDGQPSGVVIDRAVHHPGEVEVDEFKEAEAELALTSPQGALNLLLRGPLSVHVFFKGNEPGTAQDDDGNGLGEVQTELVQLNLTGEDPTLGPIIVRLRPGRRSLGWIEERTPGGGGLLNLPPFGNGAADSFFDIFVEVELPQFGKQAITLHNEEPLRMQAEITQLPPAADDEFVSTEPVDLVDEAGQPTDFAITAAMNIPNAGGTVAIERVGEEVPSEFELGTNYPNPFTAVTTIPFGLPEAMRVRMDAYDVLGRRVATLVDAQLAAGRHQVTWQPDTLPAGVYVIQMRAGGAVLTQRVTLVK